MSLYALAVKAHLSRREGDSLLDPILAGLTPWCMSNWTKFSDCIAVTVPISGFIVGIGMRVTIWRVGGTIDYLP